MRRFNILLAVTVFALLGSVAQGATAAAPSDPAKAAASARNNAVQIVDSICLAPGGTYDAMVAAAKAQGAVVEAGKPSKVGGMAIHRVGYLGMQSGSGATISIALVEATTEGGRNLTECILRVAPTDEAPMAAALEPSLGKAYARPRLGGHGWLFYLQGRNRAPADVTATEAPSYDAVPVADPSSGKGQLVMVSTYGQKDAVALDVIVFGAKEQSGPVKARAPLVDTAIDFLQSVCLTRASTYDAMLAVAKTKRDDFKEFGPQSVSGNQIHRAAGLSMVSDDGERIDFTLAELTTPQGRRVTECTIHFSPGDEASVLALVEPVIGKGAKDKQGGHGWAFLTKGDGLEPVVPGPATTARLDQGRGLLLTINTSEEKGAVLIVVSYTAPL